jgi:hypothetical protein
VFAVMAHEEEAGLLRQSLIPAAAVTGQRPGVLSGG